MRMTREILFAEDKHFPSCHASTVLPLDGGDLLVAYFAGTREGADDVGIWLSRRVNGAWHEPVRIAKVNDTPHWNPVLMPIPGGARLIFKVGSTIPDWVSWTTTTRDAGATWTTPIAYPPPSDACGPVRNKPLYLSDGSMLAPNSVETKDAWRPRIDISYDYGASFPALSWIPINTDASMRIKSAKVQPQADMAHYMPGLGAIQPALWEGSAGKIHALLRTTAGFIFRSDSEDYGRSWCMAYNTRLPNNNSGIDLAKLDGKLYLVMNPVSGNWADRTPLVIMRSTDGGKTFDPYATLEDGKDDPRTEPRENRRYTAEFSYPAIVAKSGKLHVTYTHMRRQICYREIVP
ncbi:MAG: sialidase family protein [Christensenellales bacterium]|jgi:predicted neuraminidase